MVYFINIYLYKSIYFYFPNNQKRTRANVSRAYAQGVCLCGFVYIAIYVSVGGGPKTSPKAVTKSANSSSVSGLLFSAV